jgi:predicted DNA-binding transcriptional regulator YafY
VSAVLEASNEPKIVLLVRLLNAIDEGNHSFEGLKERIAEGGHRPSTRSLRRYLAILSEAGFPWHFDRSTNAYRFAGGYSLKRLDLSHGELFGLVALRSLGASIGGTIGSSIDEVTERLVGTAGRSVKARVDRPSPVAFRLAEIALDENGERAFALLSSAERSSRSVQFAYRDKEGTATTRSADPYGFVVNGGRIYCIAFDHARKDKRTFAVDSMTDVTVLARTFTKPGDFNVEEYAAGSISGVLTSTESTEVAVKFDARVAKAAEAARIVADRQVIHAPDGSVEIRYKVSDINELIRWVLGWGSQAEILRPPAARDRIASLAKDIAGKY